MRMSGARSEARERDVSYIAMQHTGGANSYCCCCRFAPALTSSYTSPCTGPAIAKRITPVTITMSCHPVPRRAEKTIR